MLNVILALFFNEYSAWWTIGCVLLGLGYAFVFYKNNLKQKNALHYFLFALRAITVTILSFLLLSPLLQTQKKRNEKPVIIIAQDNSASIKIAPAKTFDFANYHQNLTSLTESFNNYEVIPLNFGDKIESGFKTNYSDQHSDISELFSYIKEQFYGKNVGAIILASDGIFNKGTIPNNLILENPTPIYTIALGDTIPKKDLLISNINYNKIVYLENDHSINVNLSAYQCAGNNAVLSITTSDGQKLSQKININSDDWKSKLNFRIATKKKGIQRINISVSGVNAEISTQNNTQTIYVDVIDGREKILILANAPHPDIKALKQSLDINKNYETEVILADAAPKDISKYGLIILHNLPSNQYPIKDFLEKSSAKAKWFIIGTATNSNALNQIQQQVSLASIGNIQEYYSALNKNFNSFSLNEETKSFLQQVAPLNTVIGQLTLKTTGNILFYKRNTEDALFTFNEQNSIKTGFLVGEGLWRWRMENFKLVNTHNAFDDFVAKTIQYLTVKEDKRKLRAYPAKNRFADNEAVLLNAELYNDAYEAITDAEININIKHSSGKIYSFLFSKKDSFYELNAGFLPEGEYSFTATTTQNNAKLSSSGNFIVEKTNLELQLTTANHQVLYNLATASEAKMVYPNDILSLKDIIAKNEKIKTITYQDKSYQELIDLKWIFFLLILLLSTEWFLRKRNGVI